MLVSADWQAIAADVAPGTMLKVRPELAARVWPDKADAHFAAHTGVPYCDGLFRMLSVVLEHDPAHPRTVVVKGPEPQAVDSAHGPLLQLGLLYNTPVHVSLTDRTIWVLSPDTDDEYELINRDLSSLAFLLYMLEAEKPRPDERPTPHDWAEIEGIILEDITRWDRLPFAEGTRFWNNYLKSYSMY